MAITQHILDIADFKASPHFNERPDESDISLLVVHNISLPAGQFGLPYISDLFLGCLDCEADPSFADLKGLAVSAHCLIRRDGSIIQYVPFHQRAWHAGISQYQGRSGCNDFSIGVELEGTDHIPYTKAQYSRLSWLANTLIKHYPKLNKTRITGHSDIAPGRKSDPGPSFDWDYFYTQLDER